MKFFHAVANGRKNRNFMPYIRKDSAQIEDPRDLGNAFATHFQHIFGQKRESRFKVDFKKLFAFKPHVDLTQLKRPFTLKELKCAVYELGRDKALGPDGFPFYFFRNFLDMIKGDLWRLCEDFFNGKANLERKKELTR